MASGRKKRLPLVCKFCSKLQDILSVHLRRVCRKNAGKTVIKELVDEARSNMRRLVRNLSIVQHEDLEHIMSYSRPQDFFAEFLEAKGSIIVDELEGRQRFQIPEEVQGDPTGKYEEIKAWNKSENKRIPLVCKYCLKLKDNLSFHLKRDCKSKGDEAKVKVLVEEARSKMRHLVKNLSIVAKKDLDHQWSIKPHTFSVFLEANGCVVANKPAEKQCSETEEEVYSNSSGTDEEMEAEDQPNTSAISGTRLSMKEAGLHKKHSMDSPVMIGFKKYLEISCSKIISRRQVQNVARYLYYVDPQDISVKCFHHCGPTVAFFRQLEVFTASKFTANNYLDSIMNFVKYIISEAKYVEEDPSLHLAAKRFFDVLKDIRLKISKKAAQRKLKTGQRTSDPEECQQVVTTAKPFFLNLISRTNAGCELDDQDSFTILYYLQALLMLQHLQTSSVIQNITRHQWLLRSYQTVEIGTESVEVAIIKVELGTSDAKRTTLVVLEKTEEMWFDTYFQKIRPGLLKNIDEEDDHFFLSSKRKELQNIFTNLISLHQRFHLPVVTCNQAREAFEQCCLSHCDEEGRQLQEKYLMQSMETEHTESEILQGAVMAIRMQKDWIPVNFDLRLC